jgi:hypothetical protein
MASLRWDGFLGKVYPSAVASLVTLDCPAVPFLISSDATGWAVAGIIAALNAVLLVQLVA